MSSKSKKSCKTGMILRKGYTSRKGKKVASSCIRSVSASGQKRSDINKKILKSKEKMHKRASKKFGSKRCGSGKIEKAGYHRRSFKRKSGSNVKDSWVAPTCIKAKGLSRSTGRKGTPVIGPLEKDVLKPFGYEHVTNMTRTNRHSALKKALREIPALSLYRRLVALSTLNKRTNPKVSKTVKGDAEWVKTQKEYKERPTSKKSKKSKKSKQTGGKRRKSKKSRKSRKSRKSKKSKQTGGKRRKSKKSKKSKKSRKSRKSKRINV